MDQRTTRKMIIGGVDAETTKKIQERENRKSKKRFFVKAFDKPSTSSIKDASELSSDTPGTSSHSSDQDSEFKWKYPLETKSRLKKRKCMTQMRLPLPALAKVKDRTGVPMRKVAAIATAVLWYCGGKKYY